jgi:hypothetical protein
MIVAEMLRRNRKDHHHDEKDRQQQRELDVVHRFANRRRSIAADGQGECSRQRLLQFRQHRADPVDHFHRVCSRLALDREVDGGRAVAPTGGLVVLDAVVDVRHLVQAIGLPLR